MKHKYDSSAIVESERFDIDSYITYENQRYVKSKHKKSESFQNISKIHSIINDRKFTEICELADYVHDNVPELCECLYDNFYSFRSYVESKARHAQHQSELCKHIAELNERNSELRSLLDESREDYQILKEQEQKMLKYIRELGGDYATVYLDFMDSTVLDSD